MSDGDWKSCFEVGRVIVCAAVFALVISWMATEGHLFGGPRGEQAYSYSDEYNGDARTWTPTPFNVAKNTEGYTADCQHPKDHEEADLCQQWRAAKASEKSAAFAESQWLWNWLQLVVTIATVAAAWAAIIAAKEAQKSVSLTENPAERQLRAYVYVDEVIVENIDDPEKAFVKIMIKNGGQTPAYELKNKTGRIIRLIDETSAFPETPVPSSGSVCVVNPAGISKIRVDLDYTASVIQGIKDGTVILFIFGHIIFY